MTFVTSASSVTSPDGWMSPGGAEQAPLTLPAPPTPPRRSGVPLIASIVPVLAAGGLWLATGTMSMLWFAALGPLIAGATMLDALRTGRRDRRRYRRDARRARSRLQGALEQRHRTERVQRWAQHPDAAALVGADGEDIWRRVGRRAEMLVVARGTVRSGVRVDGGDDSKETTLLREEAGRLEDAPITVDLRAGVAVVGPTALADAVVRALVVQLCLTHAPGRLHLVDDGARTTGDEAGWLDRMPHTRPGEDDALTLGVATPGRPITSACDILIARADAGAIPPACAAVLTLTGIDRARLEYDGHGRDVGVEALSLGQAAHVADALVARAERTFGHGGADGAIALSALVDPDAPRTHDGLGAVIGTGRGRPVDLDLVADGPHALVAGMTGAGKSELLTTWVTAMCAAHSPRDVVFLLADFKGGTAFEPLRTLPHVTGIITDLDSGSARRALESLRAEIRRREAALVDADAREITGTALPRLVIVVDEFAALAAMHPELQDLFTDVAARGRALGMHLILGTQRAAGVFREALAANAPLRISLRVTDLADSRALIGTGSAADLPADAAGRGIALVRRATDARAHTVRVGLCPPELIAQVARRDADVPVRRAWLPELPTRIALGDVARADSEEIVLAIADEPERQRQRAVSLGAGERGLCVVGRSGSGRTSALCTIAAQSGQSVWIGPDSEQAWDALRRVDEEAVAPGTAVLVDDMDALLARMPADYAQTAAEMLERIIHACGSGGARIAVSLQRMTGPAARLAELIPKRAILAPASRSDAVVAGATPADLPAHMPPGRAVLDDQVVHVVTVPEQPTPTSPTIGDWDPRGTVTGVVARGAASARRIAAQARTRGAEVGAVDEAAGVLPSPSEAGVVLVGDPEQWQHAFGMLQQIRTRHTLLIDAACGADYRLLTGDRRLPPLCAPGRHRGWLLQEGGEPRRICWAP